MLSDRPIDSGRNGDFNKLIRKYTKHFIVQKLKIPKTKQTAHNLQQRQVIFQIDRLSLEFPYCVEISIIPDKGLIGVLGHNGTKIELIYVQLSELQDLFLATRKTLQNEMREIGSSKQFLYGTSLTRETFIQVLSKSMFCVGNKPVFKNEEFNIIGK